MKGAAENINIFANWKSGKTRWLLKDSTRYIEEILQNLYQNFLKIKILYTLYEITNKWKPVLIGDRENCPVCLPDITPVLSVPVCLPEICPVLSVPGFTTFPVCKYIYIFCCSFHIKGIYLYPHPHSTNHKLVLLIQIWKLLKNLWVFLYTFNISVRFGCGGEGERRTLFLLACISISNFYQILNSS